MTLRLSLFLAATFLLAGCRIFSSDSEPEPRVFDVTVAEAELEGPARATFDDSDLRVYGEFVMPDSSVRFLELKVADFTGERLYQLAENAGAYGAVTDSVGHLTYGVSIGHEDDQVRISAYEEGGDVMRGELFFYGQAVRAFDGVPRSGPFTVRGRFRAQVE